MSTDLYKTVRQAISKCEDKRHGDLMGLYVALVTSRDYKSNLCHSSYVKLHQLTGWGTQKIADLIRILKEIGAIDYYPGNSSGIANLYSFPMEQFSGRKSTLPPKRAAKAKESQQAEVGVTDGKATDGKATTAETADQPTEGKVPNVFMDSCPELFLK